MPTTRPPLGPHTISLNRARHASIQRGLSTVLQTDSDGKKRLCQMIQLYKYTWQAEEMLEPDRCRRSSSCLVQHFNLQASQAQPVNHLLLCTPLSAFLQFVNLPFSFLQSLLLSPGQGRGTDALCRFEGRTATR